MSSLAPASPDEPSAIAATGGALDAGLANCASADRLECRLRRQAQMLSVLTTLQRGFLVGSSSGDTFAHMLEQLVRLTGSEYGFISEVLYDEAGAPFLRMHGLSDISWSEASRTVFERMRTGGFEFHNLDSLFGTVVRTQAPVISNRPAADARSGGVPRAIPCSMPSSGCRCFTAARCSAWSGLPTRRAATTRRC